MTDLKSTSNIPSPPGGTVGNSFEVTRSTRTEAKDEGIKKRNWLKDRLVPNRFEVKKHPKPVSDEDFYGFICAHYFHQNSLAWSRTQILLAVEGGTLAAAFSRPAGWLAIIALVIGIVLVALIWLMIERDWEIRDAFDLYLLEFHKEWLPSENEEGLPISHRIQPKGWLPAASFVARVIIGFVLLLNLCSVAYVALQMAGKIKPL